MKKIIFIILLVFILGGCNLDQSINDYEGNKTQPVEQTPVGDTPIVTVPQKTPVEPGGGTPVDPGNNPTQPGTTDPNIITKKVGNLTISSLIGDGYSKSGSNLIFTKAGEYTISGSYEGSLVFNVSTMESVTLYLNNVTITALYNHAIYWTSSSGKIEIKAMENTVNEITVLADSTSLFSAIESENNIEIGGSGKLLIKGLQRHAVKGSNIEIKGHVDLTVEAVKDGLHGKQIIITGGNTKINNCTDAIQADINSNDAKGTILLEEGVLTITNCKRAFRATTSLTIQVVAGGTLEINVNNTKTPIEVPEVYYVSGTFKINGVNYQ